MYERFTDRARKVMQLANQAAQELNHEYIGTEHILLGLAKEGSGVAANVLKNLGITPINITTEIGKIVQPGPDYTTMGKLPQTPRTKKVIEYAICEARDLGHNYLGTEHLLLGLLREEEGVACQVLLNLGVELPAVRQGVTRLLGTTCVEESDGDYYVKALARIKGLCKLPAKQAVEQIIAAAQIFEREIKALDTIKELGGESQTELQ